MLPLLPSLPHEKNCCFYFLTVAFVACDAGLLPLLPE
jgi:hypothetical protein